MWDSSAFLGALTPKFYVALTGTSSLISGLILIFEWWYFRKYGTSFIERVSLAHLGPWLGGGAGPAEGECKVWRNPMALLRGAEYGRLWSAARRKPLTYYDMNLSAQDHQAWFACGAEGPAEEAMSLAWRERSPGARVAAARAALALRPSCAAALLLLAEEDAPTVAEAERVLRRAWRAAEAASRASSAAAAAGAPRAAAEARRDAALLAHVKRRAAMCARRLGRLRDAARLFRELARDAPPALHALQLHENLLEVLLEQRAFPDAAAVLARHADQGLPRSAAVLYTAALLRARAAAAAAPAARPQADLAALEVSTRRSAAVLYTAALLRARAAAAAAPAARPQADLAALEAMRRAIEFNPFVPEYLLELRPLTLPPEHVLRRGDSEAVAYAFFHLRHWRAADGALRLLAGAARAAARRAAAPCAAAADRELLPPHHAAAARAPALLPLAAALCAAAALLALLAHRWPAQAHAAARAAAAGLDPRRLTALLAAV